MLKRFLESRFVRNAATLQVAAFLNTVGNFLSSILLAHVLGAERQGLFYSAQALFGLFYLFGSLGFVPSAVSQVAAAAARADRERVAQWLAFMAKSWLVLGSSLIVICFLVLPPLAEGVYGDRQLGVWASWLAVMPLLETPRIMVRVAFEGTRRMVPLAQMENGTEVLRVFLVVAGALITGSTEGAIYGTIAASGLSGIVALEMYRMAARVEGPGALPSLVEIGSQIRDVSLRKGARLGIRLGFLRVIDAFMTEIAPTLVLLRVADPTWVAYFRIAQRLMRIPLTVMTGISRTALPALSELVGTRDMAQFKSTFLRITLGGGSIVAVGVLLWVPLVPILVGHFYPPDYAEPVWRLALILLVGAMMLSYAAATDAFYISTNSMRVAMRIAVGAVSVMTVALFTFSALWPRTGPAWGVVVGQGGCLAHYVFIIYWFRRYKGSEMPGKPPREPSAEPPDEPPVEPGPPAGAPA